MEDDEKTIARHLYIDKDENTGLSTWNLDAILPNVDKKEGIVRGVDTDRVLCIAMQNIVSWASASYNSTREPEFTTLKIYCPSLTSKFINLCTNYAINHIFPFVLILCDEQRGNCRLINREQS